MICCFLFWLGFFFRTIVLQMACENVISFQTSVLYGVIHLLHPSTTPSDITRKEENVKRWEICPQALQQGFNQHVKGVCGPTAMKRNYTNGRTLPLQHKVPWSCMLKEARFSGAISTGLTQLLLKAKQAVLAIISHVLC